MAGKKKYATEEERKAAAREYARLWRAKHPERNREHQRRYRERHLELYKERYREYRRRPEQAERARAYRNQKKYGLLPGDREAIFAAQFGVCAICGGSDSGSRRGWHIDHCHASGKVRGILCHHCNAMLGNAKDNSATLEAAIRYLHKHALTVEN